LTRKKKKTYSRPQTFIQQTFIQRERVGNPTCPLWDVIDVGDPIGPKIVISVKGVVSFILSQVT